MTLLECLTKINATTLLERDWDSYKAPPIEPIARDNAACFCETAITSGLAPDWVGPSCVGAIYVGFEARDREVGVEFYNTGRACVAFSDDFTDDVETKMVETTEEGYLNLLGDAQKYLLG